MFNRANWIPSGLRSDCKDCCRAFKKDWWARQPKSEAALRQTENANLAANGQRRCKICREIKPRDEDSYAKARGIWQVSCRVCDRKRVRRWAVDNEDRYKANAAEGCAARYAAKRCRTIRLSAEHRRQLRSIYAECRERNRRHPRSWHVDHIVPLVGKTVSGLHVPWNLQIIPSSDNCKKSNKWNSSSEQALITNESWR